MKSRLVICVLLFALACSERGYSAAELTPKQRTMADRLVAARISEIRDRIIQEADLAANIEQLSRREKANDAWIPAMRVGWRVRQCKEERVPIPEAVNDKVVADIVWHYQNASGEGPERKYHREECARALGFIGDPRGVPTILESLEQEGGHFSWQALVGISDPRFIPAINTYLDFTNQQDAFPAITCLSHLGEAAIPTLRRFVEGQDRALKRRAVEALIEIGRAACLPLLQEAAASPEGDVARKARAGMLRIRCRAVEKIYQPLSLPLEDEVRLHHLNWLALFSDDAAARARATDVLAAMGSLATGVLRPEVANPSHGDTELGPVYIIAPRAAEILVRIGKPAVPCLIDALTDEREIAHQVAVEALQRITGRAAGLNYEAWSKWFLAQGKPREN